MKYMDSEQPQRGFGIVVRLTAMTLVLLGLTLNGAAWASHPYQAWADELGIDLNVSYDGTRVMEFEGGMIEATERRAPGKMYTETHVQGMSSAVILREEAQLAGGIGRFNDDLEMLSGEGEIA